MSFESILTYTGRIGRYQLFLFLIVGLRGLIGAFVNVGIVFLIPDVDHWCSVPDLKKWNLTQKELRHLIAPANERCKRFSFNYSQITQDEISNWNQTLSSSKPELVACDHGWQFDKSTFSYTATEQVR